MKIGTKSVLLGAHCFFLHPWFVAWAWWQLYGFPRDPRLWVAFFVHDIGYWGKPNMDGPEGESHPIVGGNIMRRLFDETWWLSEFMNRRWGQLPPGPHVDSWGSWTALHSRYYANSVGAGFSPLCVADKQAIALTPGWLFTPLAWATGELKEYAEKKRDYHPEDTSPWSYEDVRAFCRKWVAEHKDKHKDGWMGTGALTTMKQRGEE
jgi:hypothetical protein